MFVFGFLIRPNVSHITIFYLFLFPFSHLRKLKIFSLWKVKVPKKVKLFVCQSYMEE